MDEIFGFLLNNPFLLLLVIGWLFATFRAKPTNEQQEQQREQRTRQAQQRQAQQRQAQQRSEQRRRTAEESGQRTFTEQVGQPLGRIDVEQRPVTTQSHTDEQMSVEDQRLEQLEQLQNRLGAHVTQLEDVDAESFTLSQSDERMPRMSHNTSQQPVTTSNLSKRFNRQGLVDSIIMAEVLGKPRAKRSHHRNNF